MKKTDSHIFVGMKRDLSPSKLEDKYLWEAHNIRVKPIDSNNTMGSITNEKGNELVVLKLYDVSSLSSHFDKVLSDKINGVVIGYCSQDKYLVLFVHNKLEKELFNKVVESECLGMLKYQKEQYIYDHAKYDKIYRVEFVDTKPIHNNDYSNGHILTLLYEGDLNFDIEHPIECFMIKESEYINKVYWIDGINQFRCINITKDQLIEKYLNRTEINTEAKKDIQSKGYGISCPFYLSRDVYTTRNPFDIIQEVNLKEKVFIKRRDDLNGVFPPCTILYALSYYNKYGSETNLIYVSELLNASPIDRGGEANTLVSCSFQIDVTNILSDFDYMRLYSIKRTTKDGNVEARIVDEVAVSDITGDKTTKLFHKDDELYIPVNDLEKDVKVDSSSVTINSLEDSDRVYINMSRANNNFRILGLNGITYQFIKLDHIKYLKDLGYEFIRDGNKITPVHDSSNPIYYYTYNTILKHTFYDNNTSGEIIDPKEFIAKNRTTLIPKTMSHFENVLFLGNYEYKIKDLRQILKEKGYFKNSKYTNSSRSSTDNMTVKYAKRSIDINDSAKNKKYHYSNQLKYNTSYLKWNENYRLGFQCLDRYGKWSDPIWIKDIGNGIDNNDIINRPSLEEGILSLPFPYVDLTFDESGNMDNYPTKQLLMDLYNEGYRTIRPVVVLPTLSDKRVVALGIITPTVFLDMLRVKNAPYAQPSWFIRPIMHPYKTDFSKMLFIEYRNLRPLQVPRSFTFYKKVEGYNYISKYFYSALLPIKLINGNIDNKIDEYIGVSSTYLNKFFQYSEYNKGNGVLADVPNDNFCLNQAVTVENKPAVEDIINFELYSVDGVFNFDRHYCEILNTDLLYPFNFLYLYKNSSYFTSHSDDPLNSHIKVPGKDLYINNYVQQNYYTQRLNMYDGIFINDEYYQNHSYEGDRKILALNKLSSLALKGRYRVDQSIQTFHSPDIEFDEALKGLYFGNYDIQIDGIIPVKNENVTNYKVVETLSATASNTLGFMDKAPEGLLVTDALYNDAVVDYKLIDSESNGDYTGYFTGDSGFGGSGSAVGNWYIYPWLKHGSINNDVNRGVNEGVKSSELKFNQTSSLKFLERTIYFDKNVSKASDLPIISSNMSMVDFMLDDSVSNSDVIGNICLAEALLFDLQGGNIIKIDDYVYMGNIDQANLVFSSYTNDPYEICYYSGCPNIWNGSLFVWDGNTKDMTYWGDQKMQTLDRTSGWAKPGFTFNDSVPVTIPDGNGNYKKVDYSYTKKFMDYEANNRYRYLYFEKGLDLNNDPVRIKYQTTPHLVLKFKLYGAGLNDSIFTPDSYIIGTSQINDNKNQRPPAIRVYALTKSYIDQFDSHEKKEKKGENPFNIATNQRVFINVGKDFCYEDEGEKTNIWFRRNHIYFYTGEGMSGYGFYSNVFEPGTLFVDLNGLYYRLTDEWSSLLSDIERHDNRHTITRTNSARNCVEPIDFSTAVSISLETKPTIAGYEWNYRTKKWYNSITSLSLNSINDWTKNLCEEDNDDPFLFQISLINKNHKNVFGGESEYAIENNVWVPANVAQPIDLENGNVLLWFYGDTWFQRYDCLRTYMNSTDDENQLTEIVSFMVETNINIDGRYDRNRGNLNNTVMTHTNFNLLNRVYTLSDNVFVFKILDGDTYKNIKYPTNIIWSLEKNNNSNIDNYALITELAQTTMDSRMGEVTDIEVFHNYIYILQKNGFSRLKYKDTILLSTAQGMPVEIANSAKVDGYEIQNNNIGCNNKWSVLVTDDFMYFVDSYTGGIYVIPDGQTTKKQVQSLSTGALFDTWCRKYYSPDSWKPKYVDGRMIYTGIRTFYDSFNDNVYFTANYVDGGDTDDDKQLMFCKLLMTFESYMPYWKNTVGMFNIDDGLYTITTESIKECVKEAVYDPDDPELILEPAIYKDNIVSKVWLMWKGEYNRFYGNVEPYSITFISNKGKGLDGAALIGFNKIFDNISFIADVKENDDNKLKFLDSYAEIQLIEDEKLKTTLIKDGYGEHLLKKRDLRRRNIIKKPFDHIRVWNEYLDSTMVPLNFNMLKPSNMKQFERVWRVLIPRDKRYKLQRISNPWTYITLAKFPNDASKTTDGYRADDSNDFRMELHNVDVDFFIRQ